MDNVILVIAAVGEVILGAMVVIATLRLLREREAHAKTRAQLTTRLRETGEALAQTEGQLAAARRELRRRRMVTPDLPQYPEIVIEDEASPAPAAAIVH